MEKNVNAPPWGKAPSAPGVVANSCPCQSLVAANTKCRASAEGKLRLGTVSRKDAVVQEKPNSANTAAKACFLMPTA